MCEQCRFVDGCSRFIGAALADGDVAVVVATPAYQSELEHNHEELEQAVEKRTAALREMWMRVVHAQDEERRRLSRDLHDNVGQSLAAAKMSTAPLAQRPQSRTPEAFAQLDGILEACLMETRTLSCLLHPTILDEVGFTAAMNWHAEDFANRSGTRVNVTAPVDAARLPAAVEIALFRILEESLTNVHQHAKAESVDIRLELNDVMALMEIRDYGEGIAAELTGPSRSNSAGMGLAGIRERVSELGGKMEIERANPGTRLRATIPLVTVRGV